MIINNNIIIRGNQRLSKSTKNLFCLKNPNIPHFAKNLTSTFISSIYPIHSITVLTLNFRFSHPSMRSTSISNLNFFSPITLCPHLTTYKFFYQGTSLLPHKNDLSPYKDISLVFLDQPYHRCACV